MPRSKHWVAACTLALLPAGAALALDSPPIIWSIPAHSTVVVAVEFTADGQTILSAAGSEARTWRAADGAAVQAFGGQPSSLLDAAISPDGDFIAVGFVAAGYPPSAQMNLYNTQDGALVATYAGAHVAFSPDGALVASGGAAVNRHASVHRLSDGAEVGLFSGGWGTISDLAFSPDSALLALACTDHTVKVWDVATRTLVHTLTGFTDYASCVAFSPDGELIAAGAGGWDAPSDATVKVWRTGDGSLVHDLAGHGVWTYAIAFSSDGQSVLSSGRDSQNPNTYSLKVWDAGSGALVQTYDGLATDLAFDPADGRYCFGKLDGTLVLAGAAASAVERIPRAAAATLEQNVPNPFNPLTTIGYVLPESGAITLAIYAVDGRRVRTLARGHATAGRHAAIWDGRDDAGRTLPAGSYLYRLVTDAGVTARSLVLLK